MRYSIAAVTFFGCLCTGAAEQWLKLTSPDFELYTTAGEKTGRNAILFFEQVRSTFQQIAKSKPAASRPVRIILFRSEKEYKPYRPSESAAAFFLSGDARDHIVIQSFSQEHSALVIHEYAHLMVSQAGLELPAWLNEGLAEVYSTLRPVGSKSEIGAIIPGRSQELRAGGMMPLAALMQVDHDSPYYNEKNKAGMFYAESWALTHMLALHPEYQPKFSQMLGELVRTRSASATFQKVYGKTLAEVEKDFQAYLQGSRMFVGIFDVKMEKTAEKPSVEQVSDFEARLALAGLLAGAPHSRQQAWDAYQRLAAENPKAREPEEGLTWIALREHKNPEAARHFARAGELGSRDAKLYYYAAARLHGELSDADFVAALRKAAELDPANYDAQRWLASIAMNALDYKEAVFRLKQVKKVDRKDAFPYFHALAYASFELNDPAGAKLAAERMRKFADTPEQIAQSEQLAALIERGKQGPSSIAHSSVAHNSIAPSSIAPSKTPAWDVEAPTLKRPAEPSFDPAGAPPVGQPSPQPKDWRSVDGKLERVDCLGATLRLHLASGGKKLAFLILVPETVVIKNSPGTFHDFTCGDQKPTSLTIDYVEQQDREPGAAGIVKALEFK